MGLLMAPLHSASRTIRPSARTRCTRATCASPLDLLVEPKRLLTSISHPKTKNPHEAGFVFWGG